MVEREDLGLFLKLNLKKTNQEEVSTTTVAAVTVVETEAVTIEIVADQTGKIFFEKKVKRQIYLPLFLFRDASYEVRVSIKYVDFSLRSK